MGVDESDRAYLGKQFDEIRELISRSENTNLQNHQKTQQTLALHAGHIKKLWHRVGSEPSLPPPNAGPEEKKSDDKNKKSDPPIEDQLDDQGLKISQHDMDIAGLQGQLIAMESRRQKEMGDLREQLAANNVAMGLSEKTPSGVRKENKLRQYAALIAAITGLITTLAGAYATMTGRFPGQAPPVAPTVQIIHPGAAPSPTGEDRVLMPAPSSHP